MVGGRKRRVGERRGRRRSWENLRMVAMLGGGSSSWRSSCLSLCSSMVETPGGLGREG